MLITSMTFIFVFLPIALMLYYFVDNKVKDIVLLIINLLFYALGAIEYLILFSFALLMNVFIARTMSMYSRGRLIKKCLLLCGIALNTGLLVYYKYSGLLISSLGQTIQKEIQIHDIMLPLGISFFTFKAISYLVDIYSQKAVLTESPVKDALYLSFFAQIQSGPLSRYNDMSLYDGKRFNFDLFSEGVFRFIIGFSKKILIANTLANITSEIFNAPFENFSTAYAWLGSICYSLQLFFDFAGYSDMAIGITKMFGYNCHENFNYPYITESVAGFWRRWHITLSEWFRDYIYIPMGGSRTKRKWRAFFNLFVVWILTGIWHGAAWNFIVWGLGYFVAISFEKTFDLPRKLKSRMGRIIYRLLTLLFINFQWVIFNSKDVISGFRYIKRMVIPFSNELANRITLFLLKDYCLYIIIAFVLSTPIVPLIDEKLKMNKIAHSIYDIFVSLAVMGAFILAVSFVVAGQNNPFAYTNF